MNNTCEPLLPTCEAQVYTCCNHDDNVEIPHEYKGWDDFVPYIKAAADGIEDDIAAEWARFSAIEFCKKTHILKRKTIIKGQACVSDYDICLSDIEMVGRITKLSVNGICYKARQSFSCKKEQYTFSFYPQNTVDIYPPISKDGDLIEVYWTAYPAKDACLVDSRLYEEYTEAIINGTLAKLFVMSGYKFTDIKTAAYYRQLFMLDMKNAIYDEMSNHSTMGNYLYKPRILKA